VFKCARVCITYVCVCDNWEIAEIVRFGDRSAYMGDDLCERGSSDSVLTLKEIEQSQEIIKFDCHYYISILY